MWPSLVARLANSASFSFLTRHSIGLYAHYIIILMPGPFILIGLFLANISTWLQRPPLWDCIHTLWNLYLYMYFDCGAVLLAAQQGCLIQCMGTLTIESFHTHIIRTCTRCKPPYTKPIRSRNSHHFKHVYVSSDAADTGGTALSRSTDANTDNCVRFNQLCSFCPVPLMDLRLC